jgi:glycosyltransferase involved in cell wall biosynthesis
VEIGCGTGAVLRMLHAMNFAQEYCCIDLSDLTFAADASGWSLSRSSFMKVLVAHNTYQHTGGEDTVFRNETQLLRQHGHEIVEYLDDNRRIPELGHTRLSIETMWSRSSYKKLSAVFANFRPDVAHFHNTFPLISPSAYYAAKKHGVAVVQTLHNFRLLCPNAIFLRNGRICEDCLGKTVALPGVIHGCYRDSRSASAVVAAMVGMHRTMGTWNKAVDLYIALSEFARSKFIRGGLLAEKVVVKPNGLAEDPGQGSGDGNFALYAGRLSAEKGIGILLSAWSGIGHDLPLKIVGDGPASGEVRQACHGITGVEWLGVLPRSRVLSLMKQARFIVISSICYENFPAVAVEAFATGTPVAASNVGSLPSIVEDGRTGLLFRSGDASDLRAKALALASDPNRLAAMRRKARREFETRYSPSASYPLLIEAYRRAIWAARTGAAAEPVPAM